MRAPGEHLDKIVVKVVVELSLKIPLEGARLELARFKHEPIRVQLERSIFDSHFHLDAAFDRRSGPNEQRVFVARQLAIYASEIFLGLGIHAREISMKFAGVSIS